MKTKLMTIIAMCIMVTATAYAQTSEKMHKIEKGETIESIAQKYGVTVEDIQKANPNAGGYFFAGMSIKIPEKITVTENVETTTATSVLLEENNPIFQSANTVSTNPSTGEVEDNGLAKKDFTPHWEPSFELGFGFLEDGSAYKIIIGGSYHFAKSFYTKGSIGYNSSNYNKLTSTTKPFVSSVDAEAHMHFIYIPLELGYNGLVNEKNWGIIPFVGLGLNWGLKGTSKVETYYRGETTSQKNDLEIGGKLGFEGRLGLHVLLAGFRITGSYHLPLNEKQEGFFGKDAYPELSIGFGF